MSCAIQKAAMKEQPLPQQDASGGRYIAQALGAGATASVTQNRYEFPTAAAEADARRTLLANVRNAWITGVLEPSRKLAAGIHLRLTEHPDVVLQPTRILRRRDDLPQDIPPSKPIDQIFAEASSRLLILGEPGAGKTTLLLELAEMLL